MTAVGRSARRYEGAEKLTGRARYLDDVPLPGCLHGVTLRSPVPRGILREIAFDPTFAWDEFVVCTAKDIPGRNTVTLLTQDQPLLAEGRVTHAFEPVALVAHPIRQRAWEALSHIHLDIDPLPAVLTLEESLAGAQIIHGQDNVLKALTIQQGDVEAGLRQADLIVEGEYRVPLQEQAYIENNGMAAWWEDGALTVMGSLQCPYYVLKAMQPIFGLSPDKVRVIQAVTGGGFGGKEEYPNMIGGHAALLARKAHRPVKIVYDRHEDLQATTKRHPARIRHRTGVMRDGRLVAQDIDLVLDGGAYVTLTPVVLSRAALHATGPYECANVRVRATAVATNTPPNGAFRGFGAPQSLFAAELHWERIARATGIDALTLRRRNVVREGSVMATGQVLRESVGALPVLQRAVARSGYTRRRRQYDAWNRDQRKPTWRGIGLALVHHGGGFTGSGEDYLKSRAAISITRDGAIVVRAASTEIGQGTNTIFAQIAGDALGLPHDWITVERPDTAKVPDSGPTVASRTCMIVGGLVERAARTARRQLEQAAGGHHPRSRADLRAAARRLCGRAAERAFEAEYERPGHITWDDHSYRGDAYGCYSFACAVVDLEVDRLTFEVKVRNVTAAADIGTVVNPLLAEGQVNGGLTQGLGYALCENVVVRDGQMANATLTDYIIPTALDTPPLHVEFVEMPYSFGPGGAKGVGELPMDVPAPAVAAAVLQATGRLIPRLPLLPERIFEAVNAPAIDHGAPPRRGGAERRSAPRGGHHR